IEPEERRQTRALLIVVRQVDGHAERGAVRARHVEALDDHLREIRVQVFVVRQLLPRAVLHQELLRHRLRPFLGDDELLHVGIQDRRHALPDAVIVAFEDPRLRGGLDDDLIDERLRSDFLRVLVVDRPLEEHAAAVLREEHRTAAATAAAPATTTAPTTSAAAPPPPYADKRAGGIGQCGVRRPTAAAGTTSAGAG